MKLISIIHALFLFLPTLVLADSWHTKSDMQFGRQEIYAEVVNGMIYIPGGILKDGVTTSSALEAYDVKNNVWLSKASLPEPRHHITPAVVGNKLYAIGGFDGPYPNWDMKAEVFVYDIQHNTWQQGRSLPKARGEHIAVVVEGKIHVIGGRVRSPNGKSHFDSYVDTNTHVVYDPSIDKWIQRKPAPTARNSAAAAVINGAIYLVGGRQNVIQDDGKQIQQNLDLLEVYYPETDSWETLAPILEATGGNAAAALDGKLYVFGGEQWMPEKEVFASTWVYDPGSNKWDKLASMPTARHGLAAAAVNNRLYTIGGCTKVGGGAAVGTTEVFTGY